MTGASENDRDEAILHAVPSTRRRRGWWIAGLLFVLLLYIASPYISFWRFAAALQTSDKARLERYVEFPSVRESLKQQLRAQLSKSIGQKKDTLSGYIERLGPSLIDQLVDQFITPEGLAALIADRTLASKEKVKNTGQIAQAKAERKALDWSRVKYAFFTSPRDFLVDADGTKLRFRFTGFGWKLRTLDLGMEELKF